MKYVIILVIIVGAGYQAWNKFSPSITKPDVLQTLIEPTQTELHKCKDSNDNVTYSDKICVDTSDQHLDIVVTDFDEAAAKNLKERLQNYQNPSETRNKVLTIKSTKPHTTSNRCQSYTDKIKREQSKLRSGYTTSEGENIKNNINKYKAIYDKNCR